MLIGTAAVLVKHVLTPHTVILSWKRKYIKLMLTGILCVFSILLVFTSSDLLNRIPEFKESNPPTSDPWNSNSSEITVTFKTLVDFRSLRVHTYPEYPFTVKMKGYVYNKLPWGRTITLQPTTTLPSNQQIMIYFTNVNGFISQKYGGEHLVELTTLNPEITSVHPEENDSPIQSSQTILVDLSTNSGFENEWRVESDPTHAFLVGQYSSKQLTITPLTPLKQATNYSLQLIRIPVVLQKKDGEVISKGIPQIKKTLTYTTIHPPFIEKITPQGIGANPNQDIEIVFDQEMDRKTVELALKISPEIEKKLSWNASSSALTITHTQLQKNTSYSITLGNGILTKNGGKLDSDTRFSFTTAGPLTMIGSVPQNETELDGVSNSIELIFDQDISPDIGTSITISPSTTFTSTISLNKLTLTPETPLVFDTRYTITIPQGIAGIYGNDSEKNQYLSFTTKPNETTLPVPYFKQQEAFTCNIAAARMLLAYKGVTVDEKQIVSHIGLGGKRGSGNPNTGYIDDYGTYWDAIKKGIAAYRPSRILTTGKLSEIITEIQKGNPVMIWGQNGWSDPHDISWTTPEGTHIKAINGMHSSVVKGYRGSSQDPTHIVLNDPWRGQYAIETKEFMRRWSFLSVALTID